uniref:Predicted protein n=1 Tax=Hordeum vulgare subsp. vulgare TaxID=112509 RepID=F2DKB7_HORVV|nr:predicted protein [Hordeum vulgare subsp. vulgare]
MKSVLVLLFIGSALCLSDSWTFESGFDSSSWGYSDPYAKLVNGKLELTPTGTGTVNVYAQKNNAFFAVAGEDSLATPPEAGWKSIAANFQYTRDVANKASQFSVVIAGITIKIYTYTSGDGARMTIGTGAATTVSAAPVPVATPIQLEVTYDLVNSLLSGRVIIGTNISPFSQTIALSAESNADLYVGNKGSASAAKIIVSKGTITIEKAEIIDGGAHGDPHFTGFKKQKFDFQGHVNGIYNIYNDHYVNINSFFGAGSMRSSKETVMTKFGLIINEHFISIDVKNFTKDSASIQIDQVNTAITSSVKLSDCVEIGFNHGVLSIKTSHHTITIKSFIGPISNFDLQVHNNFADNTKIGGILGQTATKKAVDLKEEDFVVNSLFSLEKSLYYELKAIEC